MTDSNILRCRELIDAARRNGASQMYLWPPHEESNLDFRFRRPVFYPLNYGEATQKLYGGPRLSVRAFAAAPDYNRSTEHRGKGVLREASRLRRVAYAS
jgi:hypothetical protein